jgi:PHP family Zn ribbon phosphoesterase
MKFVADLHVHSRYSRATAKNLDLENIYIAAQLKGIGVVATGDFTHPGWFLELRDKLIPAEEGLFRLRPEIAASCDLKVFGSCRREERFILGTEIANIYKKNGLTRKNHNLVFVPDFETLALESNQ